MGFLALIATQIEFNYLMAETIILIVGRAYMVSILNYLNKKAL